MNRRFRLSSKTHQTGNRHNLRLILWYFYCTALNIHGNLALIIRQQYLSYLIYGWICACTSAHTARVEEFPHRRSSVERVFNLSLPSLCVKFTVCHHLWMTIVVCEEAEWGSFRALNKVRSYNFLELLRKHWLKRGCLLAAPSWGLQAALVPTCGLLTDRRYLSGHQCCKVSQ